MIVENLTRLAIEYAAHQSLALSTVSVQVVNDGKFFASLAQGKTCTVRRAETVFGWFAHNWPEDLQWPSDIPRPSVAARKASRDA